MSTLPGDPHLTVILVPGDGRESRTIHLSRGKIAFFGTLSTVVALLLTIIAGSWWYLAARALRVNELEDQVAAMEADAEKVAALAAQLQSIEAAYGQIRDLFGPGPDERPSEVWLPPAGEPSRRSARSPSAASNASLPTSWPLTERGFVTQGLLDGQGEDHPGLDIAVPTDSYVRAAGSGTVVEAGEHPVYGLYVLIEHASGYSSLYGHASQLMVTSGQEVRQNEVIAVSGSTGRSTAPHLHFEILLNGEAVDPLTLVTQP
ncbi:MAG: M23 family metallopeptidase [Gemmatimonadota bacterium]|nr:M23 family metallopeptidase [Gemmatimonadota bacterium]